MKMTGVFLLVVACAITSAQAQCTSLGFEPKDRKTVDTDKMWTMVSKEAFSADGEVHSFEIFSGEADRALRVGIYRPAGGTCKFTLVQQKEWASFPKGLNKVELSGNDVFKVQKGDRYGFTWLNYGVIDFDYVDNNNYCADNVKQDVGSTVSLVEDSKHGKRDYSIRMQSSPVQSLGFEPKDRKTVDTALMWTMVSKEAFSADGKVRSFEIFSGAEDRALRVGIYRPAGGACKFTLVQQKEWASFPKGLNKVELLGNDVFQVKEGDRYGFTWLNYGVIDFDYVSNNNYCGSWVKQDVGSTVSLDDNNPDFAERDYSIRMQFTQC